MRILKDPVVRKKEIVTAATELFLKNGFEKTTVESIIHKLGVAKGCFYHHFSSKEEVFEACIASLAASLLESFRGILEDRSKPARERLLAYIDYNFQLTVRNPSIAETIHSEGFEEIHARIVEESVRHMIPVFTRLIEQGQAEGDFKVMSTEFAAVALLGAFREIHEFYSHHPGMEMNELYDLVIDLAQRILRTQLDATQGFKQ